MSEKESISGLTTDAVELLQQLISIQSFSKEENGTADAIGKFLSSHRIDFQRKAETEPAPC